MSKTKQRYQSQEAEGYRDGKEGRRYRWRRHPRMGAYHSGYLRGCNVRFYGRRIWGET